MTKQQSRQQARKLFKQLKGEIIKGWHIHHIDGNPFNNDIDNLYHCSPEEHWRIHKIQGDIRGLNGKFIQGASAAGKLGGIALRNKYEGKEWPCWNRGVPCTDEAKENLRIKMTGKKYSDEVNASKASHGKKNGMYGKTHPEERRRRMGTPQDGNKNSMYGKKHSPESIEKMRQHALNRPQLTGKQFSNWKGYYISPEGKFETMIDMMDFYNRSRCYCVTRIKSDKEEFNGWYREEIK